MLRPICLLFILLALAADVATAEIVHVGERYILVEFDQLRSWSSAADYATSSFGTQLASISDAEQQAEALALRASAGVSPAVSTWIGGASPTSRVATATGWTARRGPGSRTGDRGSRTSA